MIGAAIRIINDPMRTVRTLRESTANKIVRPAVRTGKSIVRKAVKQNAQGVKRTGALAKATGDRMRTYKGGGAVVAVVGQDAKKTWTLGVYSRGKRKGEPRRIKPANYAHLVEKGTKRGAPGRHFMRRAHDSTAQFYIEHVRREIARRVRDHLRAAKS